MGPIRIANTKLSLVPTSDFKADRLKDVISEVLVDEVRMNSYKSDPKRLFEDVGLEIHHDEGEAFSPDILRKELAGASKAGDEGETQAAGVTMTITVVAAVTYS